jgi:hypothetical protein
MDRQIALFASTLAVAAIAAFPAPAMTPRPTPLYSTAVQMHFAGPDGKARTITEHAYVDANHGCPGPSMAVAEMMKHPELRGMKLTGITCRDTAGASRPGGAADVLLRFVVKGRIRTTLVDHSGSTTYDMKTCPFLLHKQQAALIAQVQHQFPGGKFFNAECVPRPKYVSTFLKNAN